MAAHSSLPVMMPIQISTDVTLMIADMNQHAFQTFLTNEKMPLSTATATISHCYTAVTH